MGSTGDPPVPSGHWPDGRDRTLALKTEARKIPGAFPVPSGGSPLGTGRWPVLPTKMAAATFNEGARRDALPYFVGGFAANEGQRVSPVRAKGNSRRHQKSTNDVKLQPFQMGPF
jgi:hypothetical protein